MRKKGRNRREETGSRHRRRRRSPIRGILMFALLVIVMGVYAVIGNRLFSEETLQKESDIAKETQSLETAEVSGERNTGSTKQLRLQLEEIRGMNLGEYTEETVKNLLDYIAAAQTLIAGNASQEELDDMSQKLSEAVEGLKPDDGQK